MILWRRPKDGGGVALVVDLNGEPAVHECLARLPEVNTSEEIIFACEGLILIYAVVN